jgi:hypothetical protein
MKSTNKKTRICLFCENSFIIPTKSLTQKYCSKLCSNKASRTKERVEKPCLCCGKILPVEEFHKKFCNSSCAATYNNKNRLPRTEESRKKSSQSIREYYKQNYKKIRKKRNNKIKPFIKNIFLSQKDIKQIFKEADISTYTRIYNCACKVCNKKFFSKNIIQLCNEHEHMYTRNHKSIYRFKFNVYNYPDLFDLSLIEKYGWYSMGGKCKREPNTNGISRDHKVSIHDAIKHNYDPYYISHPINCELMQHNINNSKHSNSSLSYEELVSMVHEYDKNIIS